MAPARGRREVGGGERWGLGLTLHPSTLGPLSPGGGTAAFLDGSPTRWQPADDGGRSVKILRDFMKRDARLQNVVSLFAQKFLQVSQHANFTLNTLMDMAWTVLVVTRDAIVEGALPLQDDGYSAGRVDEYRARIAELQRQLNECRLTYLQEVSAYRDAKRQKVWTDTTEKTYEEIMSQDVCRFVPENFLTTEQRTYFQAAFDEALKIALTRVADGGMLSEALARADALEKASQELEERIASQDLELGRWKDELDLLRRAEGAKPSAEAKEALRQAAEANAAEVKASEKAMQEMREMLLALGIDPDDLQRGAAGSARKPREMQAELEAKAKESEELRAKSEEQERKTAELEGRLAQAEEAARKKGVDSKKMEEEMQRLSQASGASAGSGGAGAASPAEAKAMRKKAEEQEKEVADLKRQLKESGGAQAAKAQTRAEAAEAKVSDLEKKFRELEAQEIASRKMLESAEGALEAAAAQAKLEASKAQRLEKERQGLAGTSGAMSPDEVEAAIRQAVAKATEEAERKRAAEAAKGKDKKDKGDAGADDEAAVAARIEAVEQKALQQAEAARKKFLDQESELAEIKRKYEIAKEKLSESKMKDKAMQMTLDELKKKMGELKQALIDKGIDVGMFEDSFKDLGLQELLTSPEHVFDRLYRDAINRHRGGRKSRRLSNAIEGEGGSLYHALKNSRKIPYRERMEAREREHSKSMDQDSRSDGEGDGSEGSNLSSAASGSDSASDGGGGAQRRRRRRGADASRGRSPGLCPKCGYSLEFAREPSTSQAPEKAVDAEGRFHLGRPHRATTVTNLMITGQSVRDYLPEMPSFASTMPSRMTFVGTGGIKLPRPNLFVGKTMHIAADMEVEVKGRPTLPRKTFMSLSTFLRDSSGDFPDSARNSLTISGLLAPEISAPRRAAPAAAEADAGPAPRASQLSAEDVLTARGEPQSPEAGRSVTPARAHAPSPPPAAGRLPPPHAPMSPDVVSWSGLPANNAPLRTPRSRSPPARPPSQQGERHKSPRTSPMRAGSPHRGTRGPQQSPQRGEVIVVLSRLPAQLPPPPDVRSSGSGAVGNAGLGLVRGLGLGSGPGASAAREQPRAVTAPAGATRKEAALASAWVGAAASSPKAARRGGETSSSRTPSASALGYAAFGLGAGLPGVSGAASNAVSWLPSSDVAAHVELQEPSRASVLRASATVSAAPHRRPSQASLRREPCLVDLSTLLGASVGPALVFAVAGSPAVAIASSRSAPQLAPKGNLRQPEKASSKIHLRTPAIMDIRGKKHDALL